MSSAAAGLRRKSARIASLPERAVRAGADAFNRAIIKQLQQDTGGDQKLSGAGGRRRRSTKLATTTRISGGGRIASAVITASPKNARGQWTWLEEGTDDHIVGRRRDGQGGLHMNMGGGWKTGPWRVRGSRAKNTFTKGAKTGRADARREMDRLLHEAVSG